MGYIRDVLKLPDSVLDPIAERIVTTANDCICGDTDDQLRDVLKEFMIETEHDRKMVYIGFMMCGIAHYDTLVVD